MKKLLVGIGLLLAFAAAPSYAQSYPTGTPAPPTAPQLSVGSKQTPYAYSADNGSDLWWGNGLVSPLYAPVSLAVASSPGTLVTGVSGKTILVIGCYITNVVASGTMTFETSTGSTALTGALSFPANGAFYLPNSKFGYFRCNQGDSLLLAETGTSNVQSGYIVYVMY